MKNVSFPKNTAFFRAGSPLRAYACAEPEEIRKKRQAFSEKRKRLPKGKSMGCVFVNPAGMSAGALIEDCGLKGLRVGNAYVSEAHANFIINGGAASAEIEALISMVKERVFRQTGILLREEIKRVPNP